MPGPKNSVERMFVSRIAFWEGGLAALESVPVPVPGSAGVDSGGGTETVDVGSAVG